jgi:hypothetical protein
MVWERYLGFRREFAKIPGDEMYATTRWNQVMPVGTGIRYPKEICRVSRFVGYWIFSPTPKEKYARVTLIDE